jgi:hypothetical protein
MIVMLYEVYFKSVDDACGAWDGSFCIRKPMSKQLAAAGAVGDNTATEPRRRFARGD